MVGIRKKRPVLISIVCIVGWIMVIVSFLNAFSPAVKKIGEFYPAVCSLVVCLQFISFVGIWYMKRWGVNLFVISFFSQNIVYIYMNYFDFKGGSGAPLSVFFSFLSAVFIILLLFYYRKMDINL